MSQALRSWYYITVASSSINGAKINRRRYARSLTEQMGVPGATSLLMTTVIQVTAGMGLRSISIVSNAAILVN